MRDVHAHDSNVALGKAVAVLIVKDGEIVAHGLLALNARAQTHADERAVADRFGKFCKGLDARHRHMTLVHDLYPVNAGLAEQVFLGLRHEAKEMRKKNY